MAVVSVALYRVIPFEIHIGNSPSNVFLGAMQGAEALTNITTRKIKLRMQRLCERVVEKQDVK